MKLLCESCGALAEGRLATGDGGAALVCGTCGAAQAVAGSPDSTSRAPGPADGGPAAASPSEDEPAGWEAVLSRWDDEEAHRAYLARFYDLEGLARAGLHYREVLLGRPGDPVAMRWRDEVVKRAAVQGLAQLPRTAAPRPVGPGPRRAILAALLLGAMGAAAWVLHAWPGLGARP